MGSVLAQARAQVGPPGRQVGLRQAPLDEGWVRGPELAARGRQLAEPW